MKAMILAAGHGKRMGELTAKTPKPLLQLGGNPDSKTLIEHHIERLVTAGITDIVINRAQHSDQFEDVLGNGEKFGARLSYSDEGDQPLNTGGGIYKALPLLNDSSFMVINGDIWCDYPVEDLLQDPEGLAHLILVPNPEHNPEGDFALEQNSDENNQRIRLEGSQKHTFSGLAVYRPELFDECSEGSFSLAPILRHAISQDLVAGELYEGEWRDIGTPERLAELAELIEG
ncbi:MAG: N-acetylmuramate alpha-1-phosphate uridylyltransferase MurU [Gammaproteobacteria bacterium]